MVDKIGSKRTAERMDKWVDLHTNNKFFLPVVDFHDRSFAATTYGSGFRVSAGLSLFSFSNYHYSVSFVILAVFSSFFFRARARQGNLVLPKSLTNRMYSSP